MIGLSQGWEKTFGAAAVDEGYCVQQTSDGGYIITGFTETDDGHLSQVYLIKTNGNGVEEWSRTLGGYDHEEGYSVQKHLSQNLHYHTWVQ